MKRNTSVPLAYRVPNAPATFVGRRDELRAIKAAARRGPVVVLCGAGGLGKTALAFSAIHGVFGDRASRAVMVSLRASQPLRQMLFDVVQALEVFGREEVATPRGSDAELTSLAIDLAESHEALVLLDDLHHGLPAVDSVLQAIARYARRSIWLATSRVPPAVPELAGQVISLGPLGERHLVEIARLVDPRLARARAAELAQDANGSPWKLRRLVGAPTEGRDEPLEGLNDLGRTVLEVLSMVERPISSDALERAAGADVRAELLDLGHRGLIEEVAGGHRLHEAARPWAVEWLATPSRDATRRRAIVALASSGPAEAVEALRLSIDSGDLAQAVAICKASFDSMLRAGHAPTLWKLIASRREPAFRAYKLRAALQLVDVRITTLLEPPPPDALVDRLLWVRALIVEEKLDEAAAAVESLGRASAASGDERIAFFCGIEQAMVTHNRAGPEQGVALLERTRPVDAATEALHAALGSFWLAETGRVEAALRSLESTAGKRVGAPSSPLADEVLGGPLDFFVRYYRMAAYMECGHLHQAHNELTAGRDRLDVEDQLRASHIQSDGIANLSIARGRLADAEAILARLLRADPKSESAYHTIARLLDIERRIAAGELGAVRVDLDRLQAHARTRNPLVYAWCCDTRERLLIVLGDGDEAPCEIEGSPLGAVARSLFSARRALRLARWGRPHDHAPSLDVEGEIVRALVAATDALVGGGDAAAHARRASELAATQGWGVREAEALQLGAECLLAGGDIASSRATAAELARRAEAMPSARFATEARLLAQALDASPLDGAALEEIALAIDVAPSAARRARALLGYEARLDAVDARVVEAMRRLPVELLRLHRGAAPSRGWGLDLRPQVVWLADGRRIGLARHKLLARVVEVIARGGGSATFEQLAREVWGVRAFHSLNDGNRIRVALHRLRHLVEDDPARPQRVLLVGESAYAFGDQQPFTLLASRG